MSYIKEFNDTDYVVPQFLLHGEWRDESWHNDSCPRFENKTIGLAVWVEDSNPDSREWDGAARFTVVELFEDGELGETDLMETEDETVLRRWLEIYNVKQKLENAFVTANESPEPMEEITDELATCIAMSDELLKKITKS